MTSKRILVLGIGNILWAEKVSACAASKHSTPAGNFRRRVTVMDGGTQGLYLLPYVQEADCLLVFDAVDTVMSRAICASWSAIRCRASWASENESASDRLSGSAHGGRTDAKLPAELVLVGVQAEQLEDFGGSLRNIVKAQMVPALNIALDWSGKMGCGGAGCVRAERKHH